MRTILLALLAPLCLAATCKYTPVPGPPPGPPTSSGGSGPLPWENPWTGGAGGQAVKCRALETTGAMRKARPKSIGVPRIVGGTVAPAGRWPAAVALEQPDGFQFCGGTLIASTVVLTAGHCEVAPGDVAVIGRLDLRKKDGEAIPVARVLTHELYFDAQGGHDVALLHLSRASVATPAPMVAADWWDPGALAWAVGWGLTSEGAASTSPVLRQVQVPVISWGSCVAAYPGLPQTALCAGLAQGGADTCQGDSGGPLFAGEQLAGITSYGDGCARPGKPGVYTNVATVREWVDACMVAP